MKRVYSVAEARNHLAALVHEAEAGRPVRNKVVRLENWFVPD